MALNPFWQTTLDSLKSVVDGETDLICNLANISAVLFEELNRVKDKKVNWVGFYLHKKDKTLVLGPFQGKLACCRIPFGKGVCGTAASTKETQFVPNVHEFAGHIACDSESESEVVVPLFDGETVYGVLDLDALIQNGFTKEDEAGLVAISRQVIEPVFKNCS